MGTRTCHAPQWPTPPSLTTMWMRNEGDNPCIPSLALFIVKRVVGESRPNMSQIMEMLIQCRSALPDQSFLFEALEFRQDTDAGVGY